MSTQPQRTASLLLRKIRYMSAVFSIPQFQDCCKLLAVNSWYVYAIAGSGAFPHLCHQVWLRGVPPSLSTIADKFSIVARMYFRILTLAHLEGVSDRGLPIS